jgi:dephospho-CoA kinase
MGLLSIATQYLFLSLMLFVALVVGILRRRLMRSIKLWYLLLILVEYIGQYIVLAHILNTGMLFQFIGAILNVVILFMGSYLNVIGVTGRICSGKSAIMEYFGNNHFHCISLDRIGHQVLRQKKVISQIQAHFGKDVVDKEGEVNRKTLGAIVFSSVKERRILESIMHPKIFIELLKQIIVHKWKTKGEPICMEAPLLLKSTLLRCISFPILCVETTDEGIVKERLIRRDGITEEQAIRKMQANSCIKGADFIISNNGSIEDLHNSIQESLHNYIFDI